VIAHARLPGNLLPHVMKIKQKYINE